jgi:hypothetical protein
LSKKPELLGIFARLTSAIVEQSGEDSYECSHKNNAGRYYYCSSDTQAINGSSKGALKVAL